MALEGGVERVSALLVHEPGAAEVDVVRLVAPSDYDAQVETWEFPPGAVVRVAPRHVDGGVTLVAVELADGTPSS